MRHSTPCTIWRTILGAVAILGIIPWHLAAQPAPQPTAPKESPAQRNERMSWWREARFGMFIHWGIYAVPAQGEWYMNSGIPRDQYAAYAKQFNPVQFDADQWAQIAHDAGQKYLVITSKHHDGFCMFNTKATDYNVVQATPWGKDPLKSLSDACRRHGVRFAVYYSIMDWHTPYQEPAKPDPVHPTYNPTHFGDKDAYKKYMKTQLKELVIQYHPAVIWFDGGWIPGWTGDDGQEIYRYLHTLDRKLIVNNRVGGAGDYDTPEQNIPATGLGRDWETCMTINNNWGFNAGDHNFKSAQELLRNLIDIASKGGNYLLNVGPTAEGVIPAPEVDRLAAMGRWLKTNGQAIYGTTASPFKRLPWGRATRKGNSLYLHVFDWPTDGRLLVPGLKNSVESATLLATKQKLRAVSGADGVTLMLPAQAPDSISSTILLRLKGEPEIEGALLTQMADGTLTLPASEAIVHGNQLNYETGGGKDNLGYWITPTDWAEWQFNTTHPGRYNVTAEIAATGSGSFNLGVDGQTLKGAAPVTGDYIKFQTLNLGVVQLTKTGKTSLSVHPIKEGWQPMNLKSITLKPTD